jgi:hypothetical protein
MRLVDADDAIKEIKHDLESLWYASDIERYEEGVEFAISCLEYMETIEAEPAKHGKWTIEDLTPGTMRVKCSKCRISRWMERGRFYKYCPNCGARMDGE